MFSICSILIPFFSFHCKLNEGHAGGLVRTVMTFSRPLAKCWGDLAPSKDKFMGMVLLVKAYSCLLLQLVCIPHYFHCSQFSVVALCIFLTLIAYCVR